MQGQLENLNAVAAIRVSTDKQGRDGDSPEAQREQIERFAESKGITISKFFVFLESAFKEDQPMKERLITARTKRTTSNYLLSNRSTALLVVVRILMIISRCSLTIAMSD